MQLEQALQILEEQNLTQAVIAGSYAAYQAIKAGLLEVPYEPKFEDIDIFYGYITNIPPQPKIEWVPIIVQKRFNYSSQEVKVYQLTRYGYTVQLVMSRDNRKLFTFDIPQHRVMLSLRPLEQLPFTHREPDRWVKYCQYLGKIDKAYVYSFQFSPYWIKDTCASEFSTNTKRIAKCLERGYLVAPELAAWTQAGNWDIAGLKYPNKVYLKVSNEDHTLRMEWEESLFQALQYIEDKIQPLWGQ